MKRLVLAWAATAIAATGAAVAALGLVSGALTGTSGPVMTQGEARAALATRSHTSPPAATPPEIPPPSATAEPEGELIRTPGGTVIASCSGGMVTLRSWSPAQGYSVDGVEPGPAREAEVEFEAGEREDVELKLGCSADRPVRLPPS